MAWLSRPLLLVFLAVLVSCGSDDSDVDVSQAAEASDSVAAVDDGAESVAAEADPGAEADPEKETDSDGDGVAAEDQGVDGDQSGEQAAEENGEAGENGEADETDESGETDETTQADVAEEDSSNQDDNQQSSPTGNGSGVASVDWWGCWRAADAQGAQGTTPGDGQRVALLPNCAAGPNSVGGRGDMSHPDNPPIFRSSGAGGRPSIEFTFDGDTLLQTDGGQAWTGDDVMASSRNGVTVAWVGMTLDVNSHDVKYLVSGLSWDHEYPMLTVEGEGLNRFGGYGGGGVEIRSPNGGIVDQNLYGVIMYLSPDGSSSVIDVDGQAGSVQDARMSGDVYGLTLGNFFGRNFSTTDHQFVFLGIADGQLSAEQKDVFWDYVRGL